MKSNRIVAFTILGIVACCLSVIYFTSLAQTNENTNYLPSIDYIGAANGAMLSRVQAESGTYSGNAATSNVHSGFDDTGFAAFLIATGDAVKLNVNVAAAGTYNMGVRYAAGNNHPSTQSTISLYLNGIKDRQLSFTSTSGWANWADQTTANFNLNAGNNTIEFRVDAGDTGFINIDYIGAANGGTTSTVGPQAPTPSSYQLNLTTFATHSDFQSGGGSNPSGTASAWGAIEVSAPNDGSNRVFVSSQNGKILAYDQSGNSLGTLLNMATTSATTGFVNGDGASAFRGLMYIAFHPDFDNTGTPGYHKVYAGYQVSGSFDNNGANAQYRVQNYGGRNGGNQYAVGEWTISNSNPNQVLPNSFREVLRYQYEDDNPHGLGEIAFNPNSQSGDADYGLLYAAIGDASAQGNNAPASGYLQNLNNPFGKIIRINPLQSGSNSYSIPSSNPYFGQAGVAQEIYAIGFRDPQTFSFGKDNSGATVLITFEIGASQREEIALVRAGGNYGWESFEGTRVNNPSVPLAPGTVHSLPVLEYDHTTGGFAIIGGPRVTDPSVPGFVDKVVFSDLPTGKMFYADYQELLQAESSGTQARFFEINNFTKDGIQITERAGGGGTNPGVTFGDVVNRGRGDVRFGTDEQGNVYIVTKQTGEIFSTGWVAQ